MTKPVFTGPQFENHCFTALRRNLQTADSKQLPTARLRSVYYRVELAHWESKKKSNLRRGEKRKSECGEKERRSGKSGEDGQMKEGSRPLTASCSGSPVKPHLDTEHTTSSKKRSNPKSYMSFDRKHVSVN